MTVKESFTLVRAPAKSGGVRYESRSLPQGETKPWTIYVPQAIVRLASGGFEPFITVTIEKEEE